MVPMSVVSEPVSFCPLIDTVFFSLTFVEKFSLLRFGAAAVRPHGRTDPFFCFRWGVFFAVNPS